MNVSTTTVTANTGSFVFRVTKLVEAALGLVQKMPASVTAFIARFSIAAVFWKSGQTKIYGLSIDIVEGRFEFGWPELSDTALFLFEEEYALPLISPELAAPLSAVAEHVLPLFILLGLATRFSALGLLVMTLVIQIFVYPGDYAMHGTWAAVLLYLMANGAGKFSLDHLLAKRREKRTKV